MRKHILGFAIFNLIFASFALAFAFFYTPAIPPRETVKPPIAQTETREERPYTCQMKRNKISYEVQSSEFDLEKNKFVTKLTISWNGEQLPPREIMVEPVLFNLDNVEKSVADSKLIDAKKLVDPFKDGWVATVTVDYNMVQSNLDARNKNIYVVFNFRESATGNYLMKTNTSLPEAHQVLVNFGKSSSVKPNVILKGRVIPQ